ncbi:MAG TPA: MFS transporter [Chloroflexota bacterium]|nr:MFS transporter [Chloroflexota bacterium]
MSRWVELPVNAIAICLVVVIANLGNTIVAPVLPSIRDYFGSSAADVALMVSGFGFGRLAMDLPAGALTSRISPSKMFAAGILLSGGASALAALSSTLQQLIFFRTIMGIGSAIMTTVALVVLVNSAKPNQRGTVLAFYTSSMLIGGALSPTIGGYLATLFSWRAVFIFCALTPLISFPLNLAVTGHATNKHDSSPTHAKKALEQAASTSRPADSGTAGANWPALVTIFVSSFLVFFNRQGMQSALLPLYAASELGLDAVNIGNVLSSRAIFTSIVTLPAGALADRIGRKRLLIPGMLFGVVGNLYLLTGESIWIFTASTFLISMTIVGNNMLSALIADLVPEQWLGRGMGMFRFTCDLGTVLGPFILGLIVDRSGFGAASTLAAGMIMLGVVACALLVPRHTTPKPSRQTKGV